MDMNTRVIYVNGVMIMAIIVYSISNYFFIHECNDKKWGFSWKQFFKNFGPPFGVHFEELEFKKVSRPEMDLELYSGQDWMYKKPIQLGLKY